VSQRKLDGLVLCSGPQDRKIIQFLAILGLLKGGVSGGALGNMELQPSIPLRDIVKYKLSLGEGEANTNERIEGRGDSQLFGGD
jgi:hypothetical protein